MTPIGAADVPGNQPTVEELRAEVERLREIAALHGRDALKYHDEVERLREEYALLLNKKWDADAEVERLRAQNDHYDERHRADQADLGMAIKAIHDAEAGKEATALWRYREEARARITELQTEVERLREGLQRIAANPGLGPGSIARELLGGGPDA